jgi:hypothetical protein
LHDYRHHRSSAIARKCSLQERPHVQEEPVKAFKEVQEPWSPRSETQWAQQRNGTPHRGKSGCSRQEPAVLKRMETCQQIGAINGAVIRQQPTHIHETDDPATVEPTHDQDLTATKGTVAIVPDGKIVHLRDMARTYKSST